MIASWGIVALLAARALGEAPAAQSSAEACEAQEEEVESFAALQTQSKPQAASAAQDGANLSASGVSSGQTCYGYTGGTCSVQTCNSTRKSTCQKGYCICDLGCAGSDGICYTERNTLIAESFTLSNKKWSKYKLYVQAVSTFDQMKVSNSYSWANMGQDKFNLYQLPGTYKGKPMFFLGSHKWESTVAAFSLTTGTAAHPWGFYAKSLEKKKDPDGLAVSVCMRTDGTIMIGSVAEKPVWAYIVHGTWLVYGYSLGDPKEGGYWKPDPPLPTGKVPTCS